MKMEIAGKNINWDDTKAEINKRKHGVSFSIAARIFLDENRYEEFDEIHSIDEDRYKVVGKVGEILVVIYTERGIETRLISARRATKQEEDKYYGKYSGL